MTVQPGSIPPVPSGPPPSGSPADQPPVVRRPQGGGSRWAPPAEALPDAQPLTSRLRRIVENLPAWEPLPPGEDLVRRPGGQG